MSAIGDHGTPAERQAALQLRLQRFASMRRAERALVPSALDLQLEHSEARTRSFREHLEAVAQLASGPSSPETWRYALRDVDRTLDEHADRLRDHADATAMPQLRATLPDIAERHPEEVLALLHLLVEDEAGLAERVDRIEYLITLLATRDEGEGRRRLEVDPARLSPEVARFCDAIGERAGDGLPEHELAFHQAAAELDDAPNPGELARQLRERKETLGIARFAPGPLRAIVACNVRLANRMAARLVADRSRDEDFGEQLRPSAAATPAPPAASEASPRTARGRRSVFDDEGIRLVLEALRRRLRGARIGSCTSEAVALALDLSELDEAERRACSEEPADDDDRLLGLAVVVGLLLRQRAGLGPQLEELRIEGPLLAEAWPVELDARMRERIQQHLGASRYEHSCRLSDTRTKFLFTPVAASSGRTAAPALRALRVEDGEDRWSGPGAELEQTRSLQRPVHLAGAAAEPRAAPAWRLPALAAAVTLLLALLGLNTVVFERRGDPRELDRRELARISGELVAAYRSREGAGRLVIGRVGIAWRGLDPQQQHAAAESLSMRLAATGVERVMVYDPRNQLVVDYAGGRLRVPARPGEGGAGALPR